VATRSKTQPAKPHSKRKSQAKKKAQRKAPSKRKARSKKKAFTAKNADKHVLYQLAVQDADVEIQFINRIFKKRHGRLPLTLREDFCGTALLCATWIKSHKDRTAVGIDLDRRVLAWGTRHNLASLGEPGKRIKLLNQDVCDAVPGRFDVSVGFNFSYWVFKTRADLRKYFSSVFQATKPGGLFFLDCYGGFTGQEMLTERRRVRGGFTYIWQQGSFNPIDHAVMNHIHFQFPNKSKMKRAFSYDWRFWSLPEIRELLSEAGFRTSTVYWEGPGKNGHGDGVFRPKTVVENEAAWVAYVVAER
jgi:SAM-dependent methyltransferase